LDNIVRQLPDVTEARDRGSELRCHCVDLARGGRTARHCRPASFSHSPAA